MDEDLKIMEDKLKKKWKTTSKNKKLEDDLTKNGRWPRNFFGRQPKILFVFNGR